MSGSSPPPLPGSPFVAVDTNIVSYLFSGDPRAARCWPHLAGCYIVVSFMTVAELAHWAETEGWNAETRDRLREFLAGFVIHYPDSALCSSWGIVMAESRRAGKKINVSDAWIATTALSYGVTLVTNNAPDFSRVPGLIVQPI